MSKSGFIILVFLMVILNPVGGAGADQVPADSTCAVWSAAAVDRTAEIWYSRLLGDEWTEPIRLEIEQGLHVTPVIAADAEGLIWLVWIEQTADASLLRFARVRDEKIIETGRVLGDVREQSYAPAILLDNQNHPWIAWSGVVDQYADIFSSRWENGAWEKAIQVNQPNKTPDITPILGMENGTAWVSWFGFDTAKHYVQFVAEWEGSAWTVDKNVLPSIDSKSFIKSRAETEIRLPPKAALRMMGAVFSGSGYQIQSVTERFITFPVEE